MEMQLLTPALKTKHGSCGCFEEVFNGWSQRAGVRHVDFQVLKMVNLFNLIPSVGERRGLRLLMLKDHGLGLLDIDFQPSVRAKGLQYV